LTDPADGADRRTPVNVLTGFLGSGKTTVLRYLLTEPAFADTAVLINEIGAVGLDHLLAGQLTEAPVLLQNGCICCTIRGDLRDAVRDLHARRARGDIPWFRRLIIETTGLADPLPVLVTIASDLVLRHHFRLGTVLATVDGVHAAAGFERNTELQAQIATADRIIVTKLDLAAPPMVAWLRGRIGCLNPTALIAEASHGVIDADMLLGQDIGDPVTRMAEIAAWTGVAPPGFSRSAAHGSVSSDTIILDNPVDWSAFGLWLSLLVHRHGDRLLRFKAILDAAGSETPVAVHAVRQMVYPPEHLPAWPDNRRRSVLVFIASGLSMDLVRRSLQTFLNLASNDDGAKKGSR